MNEKKGKLKKWLKDKAPKILETVGDVLPDKGVLGVIKNLISKSDELTEAEKIEGLNLANLKMKELEEITKRWTSDNEADSILTKNIRPLAFMFFLVLFSSTIVLDGFVNVKFELKEYVSDSMEAILIVMVFAYYGSRGYEKVNKVIQNRKG